MNDDVKHSLIWATAIVLVFATWMFTSIFMHPCSSTNSKLLETPACLEAAKTGFGYAKRN